MAEPPPQPESQPEPAPDPEPALEHSLAPRKPRTLGGAIYLAVLAATLLGIGVVTAGRARLGLQVCGVALLCGGAARLVLPNEEAGMLGIRRKLIDVTTLVALGIGLVVLAALIRAPA